MNAHKHLLKELIHQDSDCLNDDLPLAEYFQNGNRIDWYQMLAFAWLAAGILTAILSH